MLTDTEKYSLSFRTGIVAGVFSLIVGVLLLVDYRGRVSEDPLNSPQFQAVKKQLEKNPADETLKLEIRALDLQLRQEYFQHRWLTQWGAWLLLGGIAATLLCAKTAGTIGRRLPQPHPGTGPDDVDEYINGISRWAIAALALTTALCTLGMYVGLRSVLPSNERQLAVMLDESVELDTPAPILTPDPNSPTKKPTPDQPVGSDTDPQSPFPDVPTEPTPTDSTPSPPTAVQPENTWPRFRGPGGLGVSAYTNLPTTWNGETGEGIRWKTPSPLPGNSSPIVWGQRVFLTGATEEERVVVCFDADSGDILWQTTVPSKLDPATEPPEVGETTGFAACTPATDGQRVYAMFANGDLAGIDYEGNVVWSRSLGVPDNIYGHAASLLIYEDLLIVPFDQGSKSDGKSRLIGINSASGETVWETVREVPNAWTTPIVIQHEGQPQIITAADPWVMAYSTDQGEELWRAKCLQADVGPSPTFAEGVVYSANEFPGAAAIRVPAAAGDTVEAEIIWEADIGAPDCASPLVTDQFVLLLASYGTLTCYDAKEGIDPLWEEDFDDSSFTSSPTLAGSLVYMFGEEGLGYVVEPTPEECKRIAQSDLGEGCVTSPAFQDGRIYVRGAEHLFCIESEQAATPIPPATDSMEPASGDSTTSPPAVVQPENTWPRFRGPGGLGISAYTNLPTTWNGETGEGIRWKTRSPLPGNSSPIVWGQRVFLTGATEEERVVVCFDADSGDILWQTAVPSELDPATEPPEVGETTGFAACTPATDGQRVYAMFANGDLAGIDYEGNVVWSRSLGVPDNIYGHAASLLIYEDLLIVPFDQGSKDDGKSRLIGINSASGETVWETVREVPNAWTTPIVIQHEGQPQIITAADPWVIAYSTDQGKELWRAKCLQADVGPSPTFAEGVVYSANEFPGAAAIRVPAAAGDTAEAEIIWEADIGAPDCASPLVTDQFVLLLASYGTLTCYDAKEGIDPLWEEDFDDSSFTSSPTLAGSLVYMFGEEGLGYVVEPTPEECKRIAQSDLGEGCVTSPAFQDGRIYVRGAEHLFCIESEQAETPIPPATDSMEPASGDSTTSPPAVVQPENTWPRFRGPGGLGVSAYTNLPTTWNGETGEGIRWKTPSPLPGNSSPIVWGQRVFLTGATEEERVVVCFDADSGDILWQTTVPSKLDPATEPPEVGETTGFAACTPATDGQRVYAMFANGDLAGIDYEGNVVWSRSLGVPDNIYGHAASLVIYEDLLIVPFDQGSKDDGKSRLIGINCASGETVWETVREVPNAWTTPIVIQHEGQPQIITAADPWVIAYSTDQGKELWRAKCLQADVGPSPTFAEGVVYSANEFPGAAAIRVPAAAGDTGEAEIIWEADIGAPDCASPLVTDQFVLLLASYGTLTCYDAKEGIDPLWEEDFDDSSFTSSPTLAGSLVYMFGEEGLGYAVEPTPEECKRIAQSDLGEGCVTSPAFQDGRIYVRGAEHLFCIGAKNP